MTGRAGSSPAEKARDLIASAFDEVRLDGYRAKKLWFYIDNYAAERAKEVSISAMTALKKMGAADEPEQSQVGRTKP